MSWKHQKVVSLLVIAAALFITRSDWFGVDSSSTTAKTAVVRTASR